VARDARIVINGRDRRLRDLSGGLRVHLTLSSDQATVVAIDGKPPPPRRGPRRPFRNR
jgi:hypothetical protein